MQTTTLNNGEIMPMVGLGTFQIKQCIEIRKSLDAALEKGYRLFDTAAVYKNEHHIGACLPDLLQKYGLERKDIFITTKLGPKDHGAQETHDAVTKSLSLLNMDYIDLYLIHWPGKQGLRREDAKNPDLRKKSWKALEDIFMNSCKLHAIGISNYSLKHMEELISYCRIKPAVLQSEFHPDFLQTDILAFCQQHNIHIQSYSTLGSGKLISDSRFSSFSKKYNKTIPQILLRWTIQHGCSVIPKSSNLIRITENCDIFDFDIESDDLRLIKEMGKCVKYAWNPEGVL